MREFAAARKSSNPVGSTVGVADLLMKRVYTEGGTTDELGAENEIDLFLLAMSREDSAPEAKSMATMMPTSKTARPPVTPSSHANRSPRV